MSILKEDILSYSILYLKYLLQGLADNKCSRTGHSYCNSNKRVQSKISCRPPAHTLSPQNFTTLLNDTTPVSINDNIFYCHLAAWLSKFTHCFAYQTNLGGSLACFSCSLGLALGKPLLLLGPRFPHLSTSDDSVTFRCSSRSSSVVWETWVCSVWDEKDAQGDAGGLMVPWREFSPDVCWYGPGLCLVFFTHMAWNLLRSDFFHYYDDWIVSPKMICWNPSPQALRMWPYWT